MKTVPGQFVLAVNISGVDSCLVLGSLAYVFDVSRSDGTCVWVQGRTRGGRWVRKAVPASRVSNPRIKFLPSFHYAALGGVWGYSTREEAESQSSYVSRNIERIQCGQSIKKGGAQ